MELVKQEIGAQNTFVTQSKLTVIKMYLKIGSNFSCVLFITRVHTNYEISEFSH